MDGFFFLVRIGLTKIERKREALRLELILSIFYLFVFFYKLIVLLTMMIIVIGFIWQNIKYG